MSSGVDVRDVVNGDVLPSSKFINKYVVRVESHRAILEPDYFIKLIETAEHLRDQEVTHIQNILIDNWSPPVFIDWESWARVGLGGWGQ